MKINDERKEVHSSGIEDTAQFGLSIQNSSHIIRILRDTIYSDKIMAVLREYSSNAWDAQREAGRGDQPIEVTMPTVSDPTLRIRDRGLGLSRDNVMRVYTQYGESTKRSSDDFVGMLGIGSKSAFSYADSFTVTSWFDGKKSVYIAVLDETDNGTINLLSEEELPPESRDETGLEVSVAVSSSDIFSFQEKGREFFKHFRPLPKINIDIPDASTDKDIILPAGVIKNRQSYDNGWYVIMGCVPYKLNLKQIDGIDDSLYSLSGYIYVDIGAVSVSASREELEYSKKTIETVRTALDDIACQFMEWVTKSVNDPSLSSWEKRKRASALGYSSHFVPKNLKYLCEGWVNLRSNPPLVMREIDYYSRVARGQISRSMRVNGSTRFVLRDEKRNIKGFSFLKDDIVVIPEKGMTTQKAAELLNDFLQDNMLDGAPVVLSSSLPFVPPIRKSRAGQSVGGGHGRKRHFRLIEPFNESTRPRSLLWEPVDRNEENSDVYVELHHFDVVDSTLYPDYQKDALIALLLGEKMPVVYGHKVRKEGITSRHMGMRYDVWSENLRKRAIADASLMTRLRSMIMAVDNYITGNSKFALDIHKDHPVAVFAQNILSAHKEYTSLSKVRVSMIHDVRNKLGLTTTGVREDFQRLLAKYPLIRDVTNLFTIRKSEAEALGHYISLIDEEEERKRDVTDAEVHDNEQLSNDLVEGCDTHSEGGGAELPHIEECAA